MLWHAPLLFPLLVAAFLRIYGLAENGYGRTYYAASVRSMLQSWHNVWFNAFDPAGFVSLDKPPVAIWVQALSVKLLGFSGWAVLLPQAIEGVLAVGLVYGLVQRTFGRTAGLIAALLMALSPINIGVDRTNNTDSCLIAVLLLATWIGIRAAQTGKTRLLCLAMALIGLGFNVKMAAAWVLAPALAMSFMLGPASADWQRTIRQFVLAGVVLVVTSLSWSAIFDLTPAGKRPYAGSTTSNSMMELAVLHNGLARFRATATTPAAGAVRPETTVELWDTSPPGPLRLLRPVQASQMAWWLPLALAGLVLGWRARTRAAGNAQKIAIAIWGGWLALYWAAFSFAGGVFHTYYLSVLGPPLAALAGIGLVEGWRLWRCGGRQGLFLPAVIAATSLWQILLTTRQPRLKIEGGLAVMLALSATAAFVLSAYAVIAYVRHWNMARHTGQLLLGTSCLVLLPLPIATGLSFLSGPQNPITPVASLVYLQKRPALGTGRVGVARKTARLSDVPTPVRALHRGRAKCPGRGALDLGDGRSRDGHWWLCRDRPDRRCCRLAATGCRG
jgi:4-amino-4-deoxy-L-arabinose transferase-like glycosyltransferase